MDTNSSSNLKTKIKVRLSHWFPILTICPISGLPDLIYIEVSVSNEFVELYDFRKKLRKLVQGKTIFMEDVCYLVLKEFPVASKVKVTLMFGKHIVTVSRLK